MSINSENDDIENCSHIAKMNYTTDKKIKKSLFEEFNMENCSSKALERFKSNINPSRKNFDDYSNEDISSFDESVKNKKLNLIDNEESEFIDNTSVKSQDEGVHMKKNFNHSFFNKKV